MRINKTCHGLVKLRQGTNQRHPQPTAASGPETGARCQRNTTALEEFRRAALITPAKLNGPRWQRHPDVHPNLRPRRAPAVGQKRGDDPVTPLAIGVPELNRPLRTRLKRADGALLKGKGLIEINNAFQLPQRRDQRFGSNREGKPESSQAPTCLLYTSPSPRD